jgi:hypothetical protein
MRMLALQAIGEGGHMRASRLSAAVIVGAMLAFGVSAAFGSTMHPRLAARLAGMGEHGVVNLQSKPDKGRLCWTFDVPTSGITQASIRDAHGMKVAELGMHYTAKGCGAVAKQALRMVDAHPGRYYVWVDTKGHPGDLRGKLFAGMAHM